MKFTTKTIFFISKSELKASSKFQDKLAGFQLQVAESFGIYPDFELPSQWEKVKIALGHEKLEKYGPLTIGYSRKGVTFILEVENEVPEDITIETFKAYKDIVSLFAPVITSAIAGISLANKMARERWHKAEERISKALAKQ